MSKERFDSIASALGAPFYSDGRGRAIFQGDNASLLAILPDECVDLVVTSPPYDDLRDYGVTFSWDFDAVSSELARTLAKGGVIVWIVADATIDGSESGASMRQALRFKDVLGLNLHDTMIYTRTAKFPETTRYYPSWEYMFVFSKGAPKTVNLIADKPNACAGQGLGASTQRRPDGTLEESWAMRTGARVKEYGVRPNVWNYANGFNHSSKDAVAYGHPAIFPERLAADHIRSWSNEGDIVLDPFSGSGTTAKMARDLGRYCIGLELESRYCEIARKRLAQSVLEFSET